MFPQTIYHNGRVKKIQRAKVLRKPRNLKAEYPGHVVSLDTIERFVPGCRRYILRLKICILVFPLHSLPKAMPLNYSILCSLTEV